MPFNLKKRSLLPKHRNTEKFPTIFALINVIVAGFSTAPKLFLRFLRQIGARCCGTIYVLSKNFTQKFQVNENKTKIRNIQRPIFYLLFEEFLHLGEGEVFTASELPKAIE